MGDWWRRFFLISDPKVQDARLDAARLQSQAALKDLERSTQRLCDALDKAELKVAKK